MDCQHKDLACGGWYKLSIIEQMANIGSEISRALSWQGKNQKFFEGAARRTLELFDLTISDPRWPNFKGRLKEIIRAKELFCNILFDQKEYQTTLFDLEHYFFQFAQAARLKK
jgi:hypothetical protein